MKSAQAYGAERAETLSFGGVGGDAIRSLLRLLLKRKFLTGGVALAVVLVGAAFIAFAPRSYEASATLEISREVTPIVASDGSQVLTTMLDQEFYETQYGLLRGEALAADVVRKLGLAADAAFIGDAASKEDLSSTQRERIAIDKVVQNTSIVPLRMSRLVEVRHKAGDPVLAARIANALATSYMESNLSRRLSRITYAREFLAERSEEVRRDLEESERRLAAYARDSQIIAVEPSSSDEGGAQRTATKSLVGTELAAMSGALTVARAELAEAQAQWLTAQSANGSNRPEVLQNNAITGLLQQRAELEGEAANMAARYDADYPTLVALNAQIDRLDQQIDTLANRLLNSIKADYDAALAREASLVQQVERLKDELGDLSRKSIQYNILQRDVETNRSLYEGLLQGFKEASVATDGGSNNVSLIRAASPLDTATFPKPVRVMAISLVVAILLAIAAVLLLEILDTRIATPDEFKERFSLPLIGLVPSVKKLEPLEALTHHKSAFSEAHLSIHASLKFATSDGAPRSLAVTSSRSGEGKSTTVIALAQIYARQGERILLIDADLRRPSLHKIWDLPNEVGLSNILAGEQEIIGAVQSVDSERVFVLSSGPLPPSPAELLSGPRLNELLDKALKEFDRVIVDSPPVLGLADGPLIANAVAGTLFIIEANRTPSNIVRKALQRIEDLGGNVIGAILSKHAMRRSLLGDYDYYGYYHYDDDEGAAVAR